MTSYKATVRVYVGFLELVGSQGLRDLRLRGFRVYL